MEFTRTCPNCNRIVYHTNKYNCQVAIRKQRRCNKCSDNKGRFKLKNTPWNKDKTDVYSEETLIKMSMSHVGHKQSEKTKDKKGIIQHTCLELVLITQIGIQKRQTKLYM